MSSPGNCSGSVSPADLFEDLWRQLKECHQTTVQEFEAKVSKLKKDRCLDAQKLEVFYNRNQQLKEQNKSLQDSISLLEDRFRGGECDRCAVLEEKLKSSQDLNLDVITKLKNENKNLEDENRKLQAELQKMKMSHADPEETSPAEQEEGVIPDSPILPSSLPAANKLRKRKHPDKIRCVRYAETLLLQKHNPLFNELKKESDGGAKNSGREVLVPNTCELDTSQSSNDGKEEIEVVAETCGLEALGSRHPKTELAPNPQSDTKSTWKHNARLRPFSSPSVRIHSPNSTTERSPSLLPIIKRFSEEGSGCRAKRKKEESGPEVRGGGDVKADDQKEGKPVQPEAMSQTATSVYNLSFKREQLDNKDQSGTPNQKQNKSCVSPTFKKPLSKAEEEPDGRRRAPLQDRRASQKLLQSKDADRKETVAPTWSIDPALALSTYEDEEVEEEQQPGELADTDCTWVSHSMLQRWGDDSQDTDHVKSGLGKKANDSLDMMFDATTVGEYKSYSCSHSDHSQHCDDDAEEGKEEINDQDLPETPAYHSRARPPSFAHLAVVRKKDERRKLKGTTCKECEMYYAHLPEEEKQKKLSACSRHRYLYVPPCTPENFWEVGFPSTQTCIERGYIKEEKNPQARSRRRQPFNALFSPKRSQKQSQSRSSLS
ncbi:DNA endonuclease RBBP8 isoform 1-T2 [Anableps anableps]